MLIHLCRNGQADGPYTAEQFKDMLSSGQIANDVEVWVQSNEWEPLSAFEGCFGARSASVSPVQRIVTPISSTSSPFASNERLGSKLPKPLLKDEDEGNINLLRTMMGV